MSSNPGTPWHRDSFDRFLQDRLPQLLADRLPLVGYRAESTGPQTCRVTVTLASATNGDVEIDYVDIPQPDEDGVFDLDGTLRIVVPTADRAELDEATIRCVGEQLYEHVEARVDPGSADLPWDATLARAWLPLDTWIREFLDEAAQPLDTTNWLSHHTHLRRIVVRNPARVIAPGQFGRVCPFEAPEGPNLGRVFTIARGAEIRDGKLFAVTEDSAASLGLSASMIPFLEHDDPNHLLMGSNMMRQWIVPPAPEPALVQTGHEPAAPGFWGGRNLLTAFVSWGADTFARGIVISESCARRLDAPYPAEVGDKLSNRHGIKGVVSRVLPDHEMPHLTDGTPVELAFSFAELHTQMSLGQLREAVMGRIARAEGTPATVPPFEAPDQDALRERLARASLPETGMETLTRGRNGPPLQRSSTVGWVYWGRTAHLAQGKVRLSVSSREGQVQGELEHYALRDLGAVENLTEYTNTRAIRRPDADDLVARVAAGPVEQAVPPTPMFADLIQRLQVAGIQAALEDEKLTFRFAPPPGETLALVQPVPHPWLRERSLDAIGATPALDEYAALAEANDRLARTMARQTPARLVHDAVSQLEARVQAFFDALLTPQHLRFRERLLFSARAVIAPGADLHLDQVGLADEIAWTLFGPLVARELGDPGAVQDRAERAAQALDEVMARTWVIVNRAPTFAPTALLAFHPVRDPGHVVRLHPLVCEWLNADFDGDQVAILLPVTPGAQREAGDRLSVTAHLARDPGLLPGLLPPAESLWGLASLSLTPEGLEEIAQLAGVEVATPEGLVTRAALAQAMQMVLKRDGATTTLRVLEGLTRRGFEVAQGVGASMSPFVGAGLGRPSAPAGRDPAAWDAHAEELTEWLAAISDYDSSNLGPQILAAKSSGRGLRLLAGLVGSRGTVRDVRGDPVVVRHGYGEGLTPEEMAASVAGAREALAGVLAEWDQMGQDVRDRCAPRGFNVLARARRARHPGIVFARATAAGEVDPLADADSRLLVGLPVASAAP